MIIRSQHPDDTVDLAMHKTTHSTDGIEAVLMKNPHACDHVFLAVDTAIFIPDQQKPKTAPLIQLWS